MRCCNAYLFSLVICLPSLGDLRAEYRLLRPHLLEAGYRVVTMDLRGHGESSTNWHDMSVAGLGSDVVALLQQLGEPAMLIGTCRALAPGYPAQPGDHGEPGPGF